MIDLGKRFPDRQFGSTDEPLELQLVRYGVPIDLTGASLAFSMVMFDDGTPMELQGTAGGSSNGIASYQPSELDLWPVGIYRCQFVATWPSGSVLRSELVQLRVFPNAS
jgi:hypothetical protein